MYIRFITTQVDSCSKLPGGVFTIAYEIARNAPIPSYDRDLLTRCLKWFDDNLDAPRIEASGRSRRRVIFWFKHSAREHIEVMRNIITCILDRNDIPIRVVTAHRPGYVIYEDRYQLAAEPFWEARSILLAA